jgi:deferrochelatase/peroxidase EfeB
VIVRRGITYGGRQHDNGHFADDDRPDKDVGLLFLAYMASIGRQFEYLQQAANGVKRAARDPIIGNEAHTVEQSWSDPISGRTVREGLGGYVRLLYGDYFYAPSVPALQQLCGVSASS